MESLEEKYKHIKGWGVDADPENDPTYPMKIWDGSDHQRLNYERPQQQHSDVEVLHSNERPSLPAVFGTTFPPSGLSGQIRRKAFKHSENSYLHWLPLLLADRVNVSKGLIDDLRNGHLPNIFAEKGWKADLKQNPKGLVLNIAKIAIFSYLIITWAKPKKKKKDKESFLKHSLHKLC